MNTTQDISPKNIITKSIILPKLNLDRLKTIDLSSLANCNIEPLKLGSKLITMTDENINNFLTSRIKNEIKITKNNSINTNKQFYNNIPFISKKFEKLDINFK